MRSDWRFVHRPIVGANDQCTDECARYTAHGQGWIRSESCVATLGDFERGSFLHSARAYEIDC